MRSEYIPSFGRPEPEPPGEDQLEDDGNEFGRLRVALVPVLDPDAAAAVEEQIRLMVAQAIRDGFELAMGELAGDEPADPVDAGR